LNPFASLLPPADPDFDYGFGDLSPRGDTAAIVVARACPSGASCAAMFRAYLVPVSAGPQLLHEEQYLQLDGDPEFGTAFQTWSHDSRAALFLFTKVRLDAAGSVVQTRLVRHAGSAASASLSGLLLERPRFTADDSLVAAGESGLDFSSCALQYRQAVAPFATVGPSHAGVPGVECAGAPPVIAPNLRMAGRSGVRLSSGSAAGGFDLRAPLRGLRPRRPAPRRPLLVQAN
jgi:hypothetical protein